MHTNPGGPGARLRAGSRNPDRSNGATRIIHSSALVERGSADGGSVARALPAVDVEGLSGHEAGRFEIEDGVHDVGDLAHSAERVEGAERLMRLDRMHRRLDDAGSDRLHPDAALLGFDR